MGAIAIWLRPRETPWLASGVLVLWASCRFILTVAPIQSVEVNGPFRFEHVRYCESEPVRIKYGIFRRRVRFPHYSGFDEVDHVQRLPSWERAWFVTFDGRVGLLTERDGGSIKALWPTSGDDSPDDNNPIVYLGESLWYIPDEKMLSTDPSAARRAGTLFDAERLEKRWLPFVLPSPDVRRFTLVALSPDGTTGVWLAHAREPSNNAAYELAPSFFLVSTHGHQQLDLDGAWLDQHPVPLVSAYALEQYTAWRAIPSTGQWFKQYFQWRKASDGRWTLCQMPCNTVATPPVHRPRSEPVACREQVNL